MESTSFLVRFSSHPSNGSLVLESQTCPDLLPLRRRRKRGRTLPPSINTTITITIIVFGVTVVMLVRSGCFFFVTDFVQIFLQAARIQCGFPFLTRCQRTGHEFAPFHRPEPCVTFEARTRRRFIGLMIVPVWWHRKLQHTHGAKGCW